MCRSIIIIIRYTVDTHTAGCPGITLAPIWLPHWPAWRWTISRMFLDVLDVREECERRVVGAQNSRSSAAASRMFHLSAARKPSHPNVKCRHTPLTRWDGSTLATGALSKGARSVTSSAVREFFFPEEFRPSHYLVW